MAVRLLLRLDLGARSYTLKKDRLPFALRVKNRIEV